MILSGVSRVSNQSAGQEHQNEAWMICLFILCNFRDARLFSKMLPRYRMMKLFKDWFTRNSIKDIDGLSNG